MDKFVLFDKQKYLFFVCGSHALRYPAPDLLTFQHRAHFSGILSAGGEDILSPLVLSKPVCLAVAEKIR